MLAIYDYVIVNLTKILNLSASLIGKEWLDQFCSVGDLLLLITNSDYKTCRLFKYWKSVEIDPDKSLFFHEIWMTLNLLSQTIELWLQQTVPLFAKTEAAPFILCHIFVIQQQSNEEEVQLRGFVVVVVLPAVVAINADITVTNFEIEMRSILKQWLYHYSARHRLQRRRDDDMCMLTW